MSIISLTPQPAVTLSPTHGLTTVEARQTDAPGGYTYRLLLSRGKAPPGSKSDTKVPYYFTLVVRRGDHPIVTVQRMELPYPFTADSAIADFEVDPDRDGTANVTLSWYRLPSDKTDFTRYFGLSPAQISLG